jgi:Asp-tRNA(Asn)/Glu-tRNA(Gln) amidotransferase A subunit family amidase
MPDQGGNSVKPFQVEEATIAELHQAIRDGRTTCVAVVKQYIARVRAYNGVASLLVTEDGTPVAEAKGTVRGCSPLRFPTETVKASSVLPDLDQYKGPPIEFGRMENTATDPSVQQQYGMIVGKPNAGQVNALSTINIRGERSVVCRGDYDRHPDEGPLPPDAPAVCEIIRRFPDALEQAAELDAKYGRNPDLEKMPLYGVVFSFKDPFDTKDMHSTGSADARYDIDFPARDHILVDQLRRKGAIIFAKAVCTEYNGRPGNYTTGHKPEKVLPSVLGYQRSSWGGNPSNVYDTTRAASLGSSSGSGVSVSANLVMASLGEETRASTRGPANHNSLALILPHKAMIGFDGGAVGADIYCDRTGILARKVEDCAKILDALKDPENGYYDPRDPYTTVPRSSVLAAGYAVHAKATGVSGSLKGIRIGVVRESMLNPGTKAAEPITTAVAKEIKTVLAGKLGATLVESADPLWKPDPDIEQMKIDFRRALAYLVPIFMPDILFRLTPAGEPVFPDFAAAIVKTEFAPGRFFGSGTLTPIEYMVRLADGLIDAPGNLDISTVQDQELAPTFHFHIRQYLSRRAADWAALGHKETLVDWKTLNARSKFWGDDQRAAWKNWEEVADPRNKLGGRQGVDERIMLRELLRRVDMMVILENKLDAIVRLHTPLPPARIGYPDEPGLIARLRNESQYGPNAGLTEVLIPAGYVTTAYDAEFTLSADGRKYVGKASAKPTQLAAPGLPFSLVFRAEPGREDVVLKIAAAYEAATKHRVAPPAFPPIGDNVTMGRH